MISQRHTSCLFCLGMVSLASSAMAGDPRPSFSNDVMAVFSKAGCNMGACHGNQNGKGGFRLSLRGQDPRFDFEGVVHDRAGRRVNRIEPGRSLILLKPTGQVAHQGGQRFTRDSEQYRILERWLAAGAHGPDQSAARLTRLDVEPRQRVLMAPEGDVQLVVQAWFDDGTMRDVSSLAVYETSNLVASVASNGRVTRNRDGQSLIVVRYLDRQVPVRLAWVPRREGFQWSDPPATNYVDEHVFRDLQALSINPSELCEDHVFVRRAFLDAIGVLPTADEARHFVCDPAPEKRSRLIDHLLNRDEFNDQWALKWSDLLRNEEKVLDAKGVDAFHGWIRASIESSKPVNQFVRELVASRGSTYENPPANFYRANRDPTTRAETAARLFLGVRLQCAKCHNHPFEHWTQDDYYDWSALFARVDYEIVDNKRRDKFDKHEFVGDQIVKIKPEGTIKNARTGSDAEPRFLGTSESLDDESDWLVELADWMTAGENRMFARAQVNLIWYHLWGRGLVEPIDDFRQTNPAAHPELLDHLANDFVAHDFDLRHLVRTIMNSRVYQLSAVPNETNTDDESMFSRSIVRRLTAESLLDAQSQVLGVPARFGGYEPGIRAGEIPGVRRVRRREGMGDGDRFLSMFGKPERLMACECERSNETTLAQAFVLIGSEGLHERIGAAGGRLERLSRSSAMSNAEIVDELFWAALSRGPTQAESRAAVAMLGGDGPSFTDPEHQAWARLFRATGWGDTESKTESLEDLAWALMNAKEFVFRH